MLLAAGAIEVGSIAMMWQVRFVALAVTRQSMFVPSLSEFFCGDVCSFININVWGSKATALCNIF
jgi:hypothetical protein